MYFVGNVLEGVIVLLVCVCLFFIARRKRDLLGLKVELLVVLLILATGQLYNIIGARAEAFDYRESSSTKQITWSVFVIVLTGFTNM